MYIKSKTRLRYLYAKLKTSRYFPFIKKTRKIPAESKKKDSAMAASPLWVSEELEYWESSARFTHIAATYSELVAVSASGQLHQWRWADSHPYQRNDVSTTEGTTRLTN